MESIRFNIFRYQILPTAQKQLSLFERPISREELIERKNELFQQKFLQIETFEHPHGEIKHQVFTSSQEPNILLLRMGVNRTLTRETQDFQEETLDNWPNLWIVIHNDPEIQKIAIEVEPNAFREANTVANILERTIDAALADNHLSFHVNPIFDKRDFWDIVQRHPASITQVEFKMISPNMSNISGSLAIDLKQWNKSTNTQETTIALESDKNNHLTLEEEDKLIESLVDYASEGGGNIKLKIKNFKRKISTQETISEVEVGEFSIEAQSQEDIDSTVNKFKEMLENDNIH